MTTVGIIAEFNPFHNGHAYLLEEARRITGADYCVVVMSGDFVQRGAPAICDKFIRTRMALQNGADAVFELPAAYACASAEIFAEAGVKLLAALGCVDWIVFGSESGEIEELMNCAKILVDEPESYRLSLAENLRRGLSFPAAREAAVRSLPGCNRAADLLTAPNNILAIEYCKAVLCLNRQASELKVPAPIAVRRVGEGYSSSVISENSFSSATAIRRCIEADEPASVSGSVPENVFSELLEEKGRLLPITADMFSDMLHIRLATIVEAELAEIAELTPDIRNAVRKCYDKSPTLTFTEFIEALKTKNVTYSSISRILLHIMLGIDSRFTSSLKSSKILPYARLLGFKKLSSPLLRVISDSESCMLITKLADGAERLKTISKADTADCSADSAFCFGAELLKLDLRAGACYDMAVKTAFGHSIATEFERETIIL